MDMAHINSQFRLNNINIVTTIIKTVLSNFEFYSQNKILDNLKKNYISNELFFENKLNKNQVNGFVRVKKQKKSFTTKKKLVLNTLRQPPLRETRKHDATSIVEADNLAAKTHSGFISQSKRTGVIIIMSQQPSVASFFGKRKRIVSEDVYRAKILKTDDGVLSSKLVTPDCPKKIVSNDIIVSEKSGSDDLNKIKPAGSTGNRIRERTKVQIDIRESLKRCQEKQPPPAPVKQPPCLTSPVKFELLGSLSPAKKFNQRNNLSKNESESSLLNKDKNIHVVSQSNIEPVKNLDFNEARQSPTEDIIKSAKKLVSKIKETQKKLNNEVPQKKELSLKDIKDKIKRSSKLTELKKSINKINEHAEELIELEKKKLTGAQPKLSKFKTIEVEVPVSPKKNALYSPVKHPKSPSKPAYERFSGLVDTSSTLPLPFGFQKLFELFKAADTVCSMMMNRGEVITFSKLKPAVEEMTRKNFTLRHLGQMSTVLPRGYSFHQEKLRNFGSTSKIDKYELVITPTIPNTRTNSPPKTPLKEDDVFRLADRSVMTPKVLKARREAFYNSLLERTKDCHEEFLKSLDPPITINRQDLKRWHPNFMVDLVPDVNPQELPQPPTSERPSTAKEILERAKDFLSSNARLHKALEAAASSKDSSEEPKVSLEIKEKVDARLNNPLKGISKSLLEKVRARQAAKALDAMRMTPEQEKEILMYTRLPDIARIVRTVFINEQKGVLLLEAVLEKVQFSYSRNLGLNEVETHIRLLTQKLPEWLSIVHIRYSDYLKINRNTDVTSVMNKLSKIIDDKKQEMKAL